MRLNKIQLLAALLISSSFFNACNKPYWEIEHVVIKKIDVTKFPQRVSFSTDWDAGGKPDLCLQITNTSTGLWKSADTIYEAQYDARHEFILSNPVVVSSEGGTINISAYDYDTPTSSNEIGEIAFNYYNYSYYNDESTPDTLVLTDNGLRLVLHVEYAYRKYDY